MQKTTKEKTVKHIAEPLCDELCLFERYTKPERK
jgi:hypothetical protein